MGDKQHPGGQVPEQSTFMGSVLCLVRPVVFSWPVKPLPSGSLRQLAGRSQFNMGKSPTHCGFSIVRLSDGLFTINQLSFLYQRTHLALRSSIFCQIWGRLLSMSSFGAVRMLLDSFHAIWTPAEQQNSSYPWDFRCDYWVVTAMVLPMRVDCCCLLSSPFPASHR